jgi:hypothetical protein
MRDIYQHLKSYLHSKQGHVERRLAKLSEAKLSRFLESYLEIADKRPLAIRAPVGATDVYPDSWATPMPLDIIRQLAIYANRIYVHDPLIELAEEWEHLDVAPPHVAIKHSSREERIAYYRAMLASAIEKILELQPLAEAGIIHLTPTELVQFKREIGALYADDIYGPEGSLVDVLGFREGPPELPPRFIEYCDRYLMVSPAKFVDGEPRILESGTLSPQNNMIVVQFADDPSFSYYLFSDITVPPEASEAGEMIFIQSFDLEGRQPVDPRTFRHWVEDSKRKTAIERMARLEQDLLLAAVARATFITNLPVSRDLAQLDLSPITGDRGVDVITALLRLDLPFFENVSLSDIVKARRNEAVFEEFGIALDKAFKEIDALPDSPEFQKAVDEVCRDLLLLPLARIEQQMKVLRRNLFLDAAVLVGSLVSTIITQGNTLVSAAAIYATTKALEMYKRDKAEEDKIRQLPSFFYWKVTRKGR